VGRCIYCSQSAGFLRRAHKDCRSKNNLAAAKISEFFLKSLQTQMPVERFRDLTVEIAQSHFVNEEQLRALAIKGLSQLIDLALEDAIITEIESARIAHLAHSFGIQGNDPFFEASARRLKKAEVLRDIEARRRPTGVHFEGVNGVNLERGEMPIWLFNDVTHFRTKTQTRYRGGSHGVSLRIVSGVYYRVGSSKGERIQTRYLAEEGRGSLIIGSRALYFLSGGSVSKIPIRKIAAVQAFDDGIQITRDTQNALPQIFRLDDPWFAANLVLRLNQVA
jgi:hypothetical protein